MLHRNAFRGLTTGMPQLHSGHHLRSCKYFTKHKEFLLDNLSHQGDIKDLNVIDGSKKTIPREDVRDSSDAAADFEASERMAELSTVGAST